MYSTKDIRDLKCLSFLNNIHATRPKIKAILWCNVKHEIHGKLFIYSVQYDSSFIY